MFSVIYPARTAAAVERLAGPLAQQTVMEVVWLLKAAAAARQWPLTKVAVCHVRDAETPGWEYILITLKFRGSFQAADAYFHEFYDMLDQVTARWSSKQQEILRRTIFFDIENRSPIPSV